MSGSSFITFPPSQLGTAPWPHYIKHQNSTRESRNLFRIPFAAGAADASLGERFANGVGNSLKFCSHRRFRILAHNWNPAIATLSRGYVNRNLPEQWDTQPLGFAFATTCAKNVITLVVRWRYKKTQVLDKPEHDNV